MPYHFTKVFLLAVIIILISGCAYFNTFYNAQQRFEAAEEIRLQNIGEGVPDKAADTYGIVIQKCQKVLDKWPDSRYRHEAILLMGISRFYRGEYRIAETLFNNLKEEAPQTYDSEANFWLALINWRSGNTQEALFELKVLTANSDDPRFKSRILLARSDILLEEEQRGEAFATLEEAANLTRDSNEKSQIYYQIASLAYQNQDFELAYRANRQVIKNTISKSRLVEANLSIARIFHKQKKLRQLEDLQRSLHEDEKYKDIRGEVDLELALLYLESDRSEEGLDLLQKVIEKYQKTIPAAQALFTIGEICLMTAHQMDSASVFLDRAVKENAHFEDRKLAQRYVKQIAAYQDQLLAIKTKQEELAGVATDTIAVAVDSSEVSTTGQTTIDSSAIYDQIATSMYKLGELDAFHFGQLDTAHYYFNEIIRYFPDSSLRPKAMFTVSYLLNTQGDTTRALALAEQLLSQYPESEYAAYIRKARGQAATTDRSEIALRTAEITWLSNRQRGLEQYQFLLTEDTTSAASAKAALFLANYYDYSQVNPDSALHFYQLINTHFPDSEQSLIARERSRFLENYLTQSTQTQPDSVVSDDETD